MSLSDRLLARQVHNEVKWDRRLDHRTIVVNSSCGQVTLAGVVRSPGDMIDAIDDAWLVPGVIQVQNELLVRCSDNDRTEPPPACISIIRPILATTALALPECDELSAPTARPSNEPQPFPLRHRLFPAERRFFRDRRTTCSRDAVSEHSQQAES